MVTKGQTSIRISGEPLAVKWEGRLEESDVWVTHLKIGETWHDIFELLQEESQKRFNQALRDVLSGDGPP